MPVSRNALFAVDSHSVLVAGGAGGLGAPVARELCRRGAKVVVADIDEARARAFAKDSSMTVRRRVASPWMLPI